MKLVSVSIMICLMALKAKPQTDNSQKDTINSTNVTLAAMYSNNISYYGQVTAEKLPYVLTNVTVRFPAGLYLSGGAYKLLNFGSGISETDLGVGFEHSFTKELTADMSYTRSFFQKNSLLLQASNENNINATIDYQWHWFKTSLNMDYAFGTEQDIFAGLSNSKLIELGNLFSDSDLISLEPAIELLAGTQHFFETYQQKKNEHNNGKGNNQGNANQGKTVTTTIPATNFNLLTYNFKIPLYYSRGNYMAEVSYQFSLLSASAITEAKKEQFFINLGLYYQF